MPHRVESQGELEEKNMSEKKNEVKKPNPNAPEKQAHAAASTGPDHCRFQACKHKINKFGFCQEHFDMYMSGVIRGDGAKPVDFEKKLEQYLAKRRAA